MPIVSIKRKREVAEALAVRDCECWKTIEGLGCFLVPRQAHGYLGALGFSEEEMDAGIRWMERERLLTSFPDWDEQAVHAVGLDDLVWPNRRLWAGTETYIERVEEKAPREWSAPERHVIWEKRFQLAERTLRAMRKDGRIQMRQFPAKGLWQVRCDDPLYRALEE